MSNPDESRARIERLIAAADRVAEQPIPPSSPSRPPWLPVAAVALAGLGVVLVGMKLASGGDGGNSIVDNGTTRTTTLPTALPTAVPSTSIPIVITLPPVSTAPTLPADTTTPASTTTVADAPSQSTRSTAFQGGSFILTGTVPNQTTSDALVARFAAGVGADHVVATHVISPNTPLVDEDPLEAHDAVQFPTGSAELQPAAIEFLDLLAEVVRANPGVTLDIRGYTDDVGDAATNLTLSQNRVDAIAFHLIGRGIAPERLTATGFGPAFPVAPNDTEVGRAKNRRVEFTLHHLLG